jgi:DNA-binding IclR family transcriptional regulator
MADDPFSKAKAMLAGLEEEQRERFRPRPDQKPKAPQTREDRQRTDAQAYLDRLNASCSSSISVDAGWLR